MGMMLLLLSTSAISPSLTATASLDAAFLGAASLGAASLAYHAPPSMSATSPTSATH